MVALMLGRCLAALCAIGLLAACGAGETPALERGASLTPAQRNSVTSDLLYVSGQNPTEVNVYSYPEGKRIARLGPFNTPAGECVDSDGNVFITDPGAAAVIEYAHGGTRPIATLNTFIYSPVRCSVDPTTGNLAVANRDSSSGRGSVLIYQHARGTPAAFFNNSIYYYVACGYDATGNLFVGGSSASGSFALAELPRDGKQLTNIAFAQNIAQPAGIQDEGSYLAIGAEDVSGDTSDIYHVIVTGKTARVVQTTHIGTQTIGFFIAGRLLAAAGREAVLLFKYPKGGAPTKFIGGTNDAIGVVVSAQR